MASIINVDQIAEATSGSGVKIPGHVVQVVTTTGTGTSNSTASSWVASPVVLSITPKNTSSLILGVACIPVWRSATAAYFGVRVVNSGGNTNTVATYGDGYAAVSAIAWLATYRFSYTAGTTSSVTSTFQYYPNGGGTYFPNNASAFQSDTGYQRFHFTLMEIAQ